MSEFIGSRISLVSRSDIRYVGTLHEIDSNTSTVALENVTSFGTEGRKGNPDDEIPASDSVYEYIVFRGSDVKDLRIEEAPAVKENKPPQVPNDPAILGSGSRPRPSQTPPRPNSQVQQQPTQPPQQAHPGQFPPHPQYGHQFYPPPPQGGQWGRGGPPGPGYPGMPPYGAPPGWMPPPGPGFPPGQFAPYGPYGPFPGGPPPGAPGQHQQQQKPAPIGPGGANKQPTPPSAGPSNSAAPKPVSKSAAQSAPSKKEEASPVELSTGQPSAPPASKTAAKVAAAGHKSGHIVPAVPLASPLAKKTPLQGQPGNTKPAVQSNQGRLAVDDATKAATAAVAAAMANLPPVSGGQQNGDNAVDNLTRKVNDMRTSEQNGSRQPRDPARGDFGPRTRHGRGGTRQPPAHKVEIPKTDFDFEESNAKFNKDDLVKEAIAGSPLGEASPDVPEDKVTPGYNKKSSFFDDLSSDIKDRNEGGTNRPGGREWRGEEQKKNLETFGQGSVDNGRGGYRGRGRGRGRGGMRGRGFSGGNGQPGRERGGYRGGRGDSTVPAATQ